MVETPVVLPPMPRGIGPRFRYAEVVARIVTGAGEWVRIEYDEITGPIHQKPTRLAQACRQRGIKVTSTFRYPECVYARTVSPSEAGPR
jgi:hypothetical protein